MNLISLDTSTTSTGYAIFVDCKLQSYGVIEPTINEPSDERIKSMCINLLDLLHSTKPDIIVIEKLNVNRNMATTRNLSKVIGIVYGYAITHDVFYYEIQASEWRSTLSIKGKGRKELKELSKKYIKTQFDIHTECDDLSDAICAGQAYILKFSD